jgi:hypothetical protein
MLQEPTPEEIKTVYTGFGYAYSCSENLHRELCHIYALTTFEKVSDVIAPRIEEMLVRAYSLTLGQVVNELINTLPVEIIPRLQKAVEKRNFLAHHFWFERIHLMFDVIGIETIRLELTELADYFDELDNDVTSYSAPLKEKFGLTKAIVQECMDELVAGKPAKPLPDYRMLNKRERLIHVWNVSTSKGKVLIFEVEDGSLWQLCDIGLGWTYFDSPEPDWMLVDEIQKHLPANINPRPTVSNPWEYEIKLSIRTSLWVKPGRHEMSYQWGVKTV